MSSLGSGMSSNWWPGCPHGPVGFIPRKSLAACQARWSLEWGRFFVAPLSPSMPESPQFAPYPWCAGFDCSSQPGSRLLGSKSTDLAQAQGCAVGCQSSVPVPSLDLTSPALPPLTILLTQTSNVTSFPVPQAGRPQSNKPSACDPKMCSF